MGSLRHSDPCGLRSFLFYKSTSLKDIFCRTSIAPVLLDFRFLCLWQSSCRNSTSNRILVPWKKSNWPSKATCLLICFWFVDHPWFLVKKPGPKRFLVKKPGPKLVLTSFGQLWPPEIFELESCNLICNILVPAMLKKLWGMNKTKRLFFANKY